MKYKKNSIKFEDLIYHIVNILTSAFLDIFVLFVD